MASSRGCGPEDERFPQPWSRRYEDSRSSRDRFDITRDRMRGRDDPYNYRDNEGRNGGNSRNKAPLLQFTTDINPACFSGPLPLPFVDPKMSSSPFPEPFLGNYSSPSDFNMDHRLHRRSSSIHDMDDDRRYRRHREERDRDRERDRSHESRDRSSESRDRSHESRDRERERDRGRDRERSRDYERDRSRERERGIDRYDRDRDRTREREIRDEIPNSTIMVRSLSSSVTEADLRNEVIKYGLAPKDIRLIREKETGASRGFAFVEFSLLSEAVRWKELTKSVIFTDGRHRATLHYSIPKETPGAEKMVLNRSDWDCTKCGLSNFRRRDTCFKCRHPREDLIELQSGDGYNEISLSPSNTLLFRNLDVSTTESRVLTMLGQLTALPIKSLRVVKDFVTNTSKGFAFVELHSTSEAIQLHDLLLSMGGNFYVDGRQVTVSFAKRSLSSMNSTASANAAVVALAAAQWSYQETDNNLSNHDYNSKNTQGATSLLAAANKMGESPNLGTIIVQGVTYKKYPVPDISTYQYDASSGYYYDPMTGLYYDATSQYYYNYETQQYLYWDNDQRTYLPASSSDASASFKTDNVTSAVPVAEPTASTTTETTEHDKSKNKKEDKSDKVKIAKKIAKEMERWAKTLNQKKEHAKLGIAPNCAPQPVFAMPTTSPSMKLSSTADAGFAVMEQRVSPLERDASIELAKDLAAERNKPLLVASYGGDSDSENEEDAMEMNIKHRPKADVINESKLTDWTKLACLLCKRQFPSKDVLVKHQQLSELHKKNLAKLTVLGKLP